MTHESERPVGTPPGEGGCQSLRQQMEQTRSDLVGKLQLLQKRVAGTIDTACDAVDETVHTAKSSALDAVQAIKCTLDFKRQATRHPWTMLGLATCVGALLAKRDGGRKVAAAQEACRDLQNEVTSQHSESADATATRAQKLRASTDMKRSLSDRIHVELAKLQSEAVGACASIVRHWIETTAQRLKNKSSDK